MWVAVDSVREALPGRSHVRSLFVEEIDHGIESQTPQSLVSFACLTHQGLPGQPHSPLDFGLGLEQHPAPGLGGGVPRERLLADLPGPGRSPGGLEQGILQR